jgi:hypothetical protein
MELKVKFELEFPIHASPQMRMKYTEITSEEMHELETLTQTLLLIP